MVDEHRPRQQMMECRFCAQPWPRPLGTPDGPTLDGLHCVCGQPLTLWLYHHPGDRP